MQVGDWLHYVLVDGPRAGECRPAVVVRVSDPASNTAVLRVFTDGLEDGPRFADPDARITARLGEPGQPGRIHWLETCSTCNTPRG